MSQLKINQKKDVASGERCGHGVFETWWAIYLSASLLCENTTVPHPLLIEPPTTAWFHLPFKQIQVARPNQLVSTLSEGTPELVSAEDQSANSNDARRGGSSALGVQRPHPVAKTEIRCYRGWSWRGIAWFFYVLLIWATVQDLLKGIPSFCSWQIHLCWRSQRVFWSLKSGQFEENTFPKRDLYLYMGARWL